ncbi:hypothetical protein D0T49_07085 [Paludibacter sp. 221]|nr:hypothetical protein [Paludibacter sp. 221]
MIKSRHTVPLKVQSTGIFVAKREAKKSCRVAKCIFGESDLSDKRHEAAVRKKDLPLKLTTLGDTTLVKSKKRHPSRTPFSLKCLNYYLK